MAFFTSAEKVMFSLSVKCLVVASATEAHAETTKEARIIEPGRKVNPLLLGTTGTTDIASSTNSDARTRLTTRSPRPFAAISDWKGTVTLGTLQANEVTIEVIGLILPTVGFQTKAEVSTYSVIS